MYYNILYELQLPILISQRLINYKYGGCSINGIVTFLFYRKEK